MYSLEDLADSFRTDDYRLYISIAYESFLQELNHPLHWRAMSLAWAKLRNWWRTRTWEQIIANIKSQDPLTYHRAMYGGRRPRRTLFCSGSERRDMLRWVLLRLGVRQRITSWQVAQLDSNYLSHRRIQTDPVVSSCLKRQYYYGVAAADNIVGGKKWNSARIEPRIWPLSGRHVLKTDSSLPSASPAQWGNIRNYVDPTNHIHLCRSHSVNEGKISSVQIK